MHLRAVNTAGPFQMVRAARALLEASAANPGRSSAVVNISSIAGIAGIGSSVAYAASKGALNTVTLSLSRALALPDPCSTLLSGITMPVFNEGGGRTGREGLQTVVVVDAVRRGRDFGGAVKALPSGNLQL